MIVLSKLVTSVDIETEWNLKEIIIPPPYIRVNVDIETEWNLKSILLKKLFMLSAVDIETEWNLKPKKNEPDSG